MEQSYAELNTRPDLPVHSTEAADTPQNSLLSWEALIWPACVFSHPSEVVASGNLTRAEKRAILASWASDARAVESAPALRLCPDGGPPVHLDEVLEALRSLDPDGGEDSRGSQRLRSLPRGRAARLSRIRWPGAGRRAPVN